MTKLMVVDGNSMAYRAYYGVPPLSTSDGVPTQAVLGFINMLNNAIVQEKPDHIAVAFDVSGKVFRHESFADYKANRKPMPEDLRSQMGLIREAIDYMNIPMLGLEGYEADDLIGTLVCWAEKEGYQSTIVSGDQDTFQLIAENTQVMIPKRGVSDTEMVDLKVLKEKYGLTPAQVIELKGLMGDASDNIPGIPGVGIKTAQKFLEQYGDMDNLYANLDDFKGKKMGEKLEENRELAFLSRDLATIKCDVPIKIDPEALKIKTPDVQALMNFYEKYEMRRLARNLEEAYSDASVFKEEEGAQEGQEILSLDALEDILRNMPGDKCIFLMREEEGKEFVYFRGQGKSYCIADQNLQKVLQYFSDLYFSKEACRILTDDAKAFCRQLYQFNLDADKLAWDALLTDYLLYPEGKEHSLERMFLDHFNVSLPKDEGRERAFSELYWLEALQPLVSRLLDEQGLAELYSNLELPLAAILADMELFGVRLDIPYLKELQAEFDGRIKEIEKQITDYAGESFNVNSPKQLSRILFDVLGLTPTKKTKTGYSTNAEVLDKLKDDHPIIPAILDFRELAKLQSTYVNGLLDLAQEDGRVHTSFNQTVTATGRLSSTAPNLQNIPVRTYEGKRIRQSILPSEEGRILISADYSQIELRVLAHMSQDEGLLQSFQENEDIHLRTASEVFHVPIEEVTADQRRTAKAVNFGIIYGQTDYGLSRELGISRSEAQHYIDAYFARYPLVQEFIDKTIQSARDNGYVTTLLGRRRSIRDIHSRNFNLRNFAERTAVNAPIQGSAADIIKLAMIKCDEFLREQEFQARMILQVHDELVFDAPPEEIGHLIKRMTAAMEYATILSVPLKVDIAVGFNWNEMEKVRS